MAAQPVNRRTLFLQLTNNTTCSNAYKALTKMKIHSIEADELESLREALQSSDEAIIGCTLRLLNDFIVFDSETWPQLLREEFNRPCPTSRALQVLFWNQLRERVNPIPLFHSLPLDEIDNDHLDMISFDAIPQELIIERISLTKLSPSQEFINLMNLFKQVDWQHLLHCFPQPVEAISLEDMLFNFITEQLLVLPRHTLVALSKISVIPPEDEHLFYFQLQILLANDESHAFLVLKYLPARLWNVSMLPALEKIFDDQRIVDQCCETFQVPESMWNDDAQVLQFIRNYVTG